MTTKILIDEADAELLLGAAGHAQVYDYYPDGLSEAMDRVRETVDGPAVALFGPAEILKALGFVLQEGTAGVWYEHDFRMWAVTVAGSVVDEAQEGEVIFNLVEMGLPFFLERVRYRMTGLAYDAGYETGYINGGDGRG